MVKATYFAYILVGAVSCSLFTGQMALQGDTTSGVEFQIVPDKLTYSGGSTMHVKFIVTNTGDTPLYLYRNLSLCTSPKGSFLLQILDANNQETGQQLCSADSFPPKDDEIIREITTSELWIKLGSGKLYGSDWAADLPAKRGVYRLKAQLTPVGFSAYQKELLANKGIRVVHSSCSAPLFTITVK
jgi:hypothetical protein